MKILPLRWNASAGYEKHSDGGVRMRRSVTGFAFATALLVMLSGCGSAANGNAAGNTASAAVSEADVLSAEETSSAGSVSDGKETSAEDSQQNSEETISAEKAAAQSFDSGISESENTVSGLSEDSSDDSVLYLILPSESGFSAQEKTIVISGAEKAGYKVLVKTHGGKVEAQTAAFDEAIAKGAAAIICDNVNESQTLISVQKADNEGIPVFLMNRGVTSTGSAAAQILTDRYSCIGTLAQAFSEKLQRKCQYAILTEEDDTASEDSAAAFRDSVAPFTGISEAVSYETGEDGNLSASDAAKKILDEYPQVTAIVCCVSSQAEDTAEILKQRGIMNMTVLCLDGDDDSILPYIGNGLIYAAVVKPAEKMAQAAISETISYLNNGTTGENELQYISGVVLTKENMK